MGQRCPVCIAAEGRQRELSVARSPGSGAPATKALLGIAVALFVFTGLGSGGEGIYEVFAQSNEAVAAGEWWRLFTPIFLHANVMHIFFNMYALWILGPQIERGVGVIPFATAYMASAAVGGAFFYLLGHPAAVAVGASGAIFGLFGIWFNWAVHRRHTAYGRYVLQQIVVLLLINAAIPFIIPGIAWEAHLGGLIAGFAIGEAWSRVKGRDATRTRTIIAVAAGVLAVVSVII